MTIDQFQGHIYDKGTLASPIKRQQGRLTPPPPPTAPLG